MSRLLAALLAALILLVVAEDRLKQHRRAERRVAGALRPFVQLPAEQVEQFEIRLSGRSWTYVRRDGLWRYPALFDAFARVDRVDRLLNGLLSSQCTAVSSEPGDLAGAGLVPTQALTIGLRDKRGMLLQEMRIGRGIPAPGSGESYVQRVGNDTIFHLHANPRLALAGGAPPMIDPHVLPQGLERGQIVDIRFVGKSDSPLKSLRRVETTPGRPDLPGMPPQGPTYEWIGTFAGEEKSCVSGSAFEYVGFLGRLRYQNLHSPDVFNSGETERALYLHDDQGRIDTLDVGEATVDGNVLLRHRAAGLVMSLMAEKGALLFPTANALLDSLPRPSPYELAEPRNASLF
jgi:hypothetical protein